MQIIENMSDRPSVKKQLYGSSSYISEEYPSIDTPVGMKLPLLPHQANIVRAMVDLEKDSMVEAIYFSKRQVKTVYIISRACVLSEPLGSGKTVIILAVITANPIPIVYPSVREYGEYNAIEVHHTAPLIKSTLVVCAAPVVYQWCAAIEKFTHLTYMRVDNHAQLKKLYNYIRQFDDDGNPVKPSIPFDIIVVKNGRVSGDVHAYPESFSFTKTPFITAVREITDNRQWLRTVYDDFDTVNIPNLSDGVPSLWSIFVTATKINPHATSPLIKSVSSSKTLQTNYKLHACPIYRKQSMTMPAVDLYKYVHINPDAPCLDIIKRMEGTEAIVEMLHGDAFDTAAQHLGIRSSSVADIFERILENKYKQFTQASRLLVTTEKVVNSLSELELDDNVIININEIVATIRAFKIPKLTVRTTSLMHELASLYETAKNTKATLSAAIDRVMSNIREGSCQVCQLPLDEGGVFINKCCGCIICDHCGVRGNRLTRSGNTGVTGQCVNCMKKITQHELIFVDRSFNIDKLLDAVGDEQTKFIEPIVKLTNQPTKFDTLFKIIRNELCDLQSPCDNMYIQGLMYGTERYPINVGQRKVIIFANFEETLGKITTCLTRENIKYEQLQGTTACLNRCVEAFRTEVNVLLINSNRRCAGLNLEFADDIVFFHRIQDKAIEGQVAGRGQRFGRQTNLKIHYLLYNDE